MAVHDARLPANRVEMTGFAGGRLAFAPKIAIIAKSLGVRI